MKIFEIRDLICKVPAEQLCFLYDGVEMNERLADYDGSRNGIGIASTLKRYWNGSILSDDLLCRVQLRVAAAAERRLDGCPYPTMSSSGSGTKVLSQYFR